LSFTALWSIVWLMISQEIREKIRPGVTVRVQEIIKEGAKSITSSFKGVVLARKHGSDPGAAFTVRAVIAGEGVEKIYPIHSPLVEKVEILSVPKRVRRAKLYYLRGLPEREIRRKLRT